MLLSAAGPAHGAVAAAGCRGGLNDRTVRAAAADAVLLGYPGILLRVHVGEAPPQKRGDVVPVFTPLC